LVQYTERGEAMNEPIERKQAMTTTTVDLNWGSVNISSADPARLADFWGKVLGRPVSPGFTPGTRTVDPPASGGLQIVIVLAAEPVKIGGGFCLNLFTDHHDEEAKRLTGLGATAVPPSTQPPGVRVTTFTDPEGNEFDLVTFQPD
jgi:predicted enzyme related to lactoylglutathione lyase